MRCAPCLLVAGLLLGGCGQPPSPAGGPSASTLGATAGYQRAYVFEGPDFFSRFIENLEPVTAELKGRAGLRYLEIAPDEGRSLMWMLENLLTHPSSSAVVVAETLDERLFKNLRLAQRASDVRVLEGDPALRLRELPAESVDVIFVNGALRADSMLQDLIGAWHLLAPGGLLLINNARYPGPKYLLKNRSRLPPELSPGAAVEAFLITHRNQVQIVRDTYQLYLRKRPQDPCLKAEACSVIEPYVWQWDRMQLFPIGKQEAVPLTEEETQAVLKLVWYRGRHALPTLNSELRQDPAVRTVVDRLGILVRP